MENVGKRIKRGRARVGEKKKGITNRNAQDKAHCTIGQWDTFILCFLLPLALASGVGGVLGRRRRGLVVVADIDVRQKLVV
jgi:hypothetical protein